MLPDAPIGVVVWLRDDAARSLTFDVPFASLEEAIALGTVSASDLPAQRAHLRSVLSDRELTLADLGDDALIGISPAHTRSLRRMRYIPAMHFDSKPSELRVMIAADTFESIELDEDPTAQVDIDGREVEWRMNAERLTDFNLNGIFREVADFDGSGFEGLAMSGRACVPHGKSRTIFHPVPTNARIVEAVAWSMDPRVSRNRAPNDVDLSVVEQTGTVTVTVMGLNFTGPVVAELAADRATADEKERALFEAATPRATARAVGIRLKGMNIRGRDPVCGDDAERVYFAFRAEGT